jgi:signal transduction histidine kinase
MNSLRWFAGADYVPGARQDMLWSWITIALSAMIVIGYGVIAFNWYFQRKLSRHAEAKAALARLRNICLCCAFCGYVLYVTDMPWLLWRSYDLALIVLVFYTWSFVFRMRGLSLVDERLAQIDELEQSAKKYREIAELLPHMVWTATADGQIDFSNQRWRAYAGDGRTWLDALHPDERLETLSRWREAVAAREAVSLEARLNGMAGYRTFAIKATPIMHGDALKWLGACADVEDQRRLAAEKEMQAKQKSFFLNALSHDIRAPLHNVLLNAHLLKMSARDPGDVESVEMIVENAVAAGDLVTKLLEFAKVDAQDQNVMESVSMPATLQQIVRRFQPLTEQKGLYLRVNGSSDGNGEGPRLEATVQTDRQKLERIISNLVDNAIKYTERGGVSLDVKQVGEEVCVRVSDTGMGIPHENVPYLFDEFYQVNNHERDRCKGFGMGLAICKCLARHIGGDVRLASTGPSGSCFELAVKSVRADRGGRQRRPAGDHADSQETGLCSV